MANTLLTNAEITYDAAATLMNNLVFARKINRQTPHRRGSGPTVSIRKPAKYIVQDGRVAVPQDITEQYADLTLNYRKNVSFSFTSEDRTLSMDNFRQRYIMPAVVPLANLIDRSAIDYALPKIYNAVGTPGVVPNTLLTYNLAQAKLLENSTLDDGRWCMVIDPTMQATIASAVSTVFNPQAEIGRVYERGRMGKGAGFDWYYDQNLVSHTIGTLGGTPQVNVGGQTGATLNTKGWTNAAATRLRQGDIFTVDGVYQVNRQSYQSIGKLQQFVATADAASDAGGLMAIPLAPSIILTGPFQTVSASPANNAALTILGAASVASPQGIGFHPDAMVMAMADLDEPVSGNSYFISDADLGVSMRVWEDSDFVTDSHGIRIDAWWGFCMVYAEWMVRVQS